jgi:hypothetical protein
MYRVLGFAVLGILSPVLFSSGCTNSDETVIDQSAAEAPTPENDPMQLEAAAQK